MVFKFFPFLRRVIMWSIFFVELSAFQIVMEGTGAKIVKA